MQPAAPPVPAGPTGPKLSSVVLLAMAVIAVVVIASIFGFILFVSGMVLDAQLWWMGLVSLLFALVFYMVFAATADRRYSRSLAGAFFVIGIVSYYASIFTNPDAQIIKLTWMVVLSVFTVIVLAAIFLMSRSTEADAARKSMRKLTP